MRYNTQLYYFAQIIIYFPNVGSNHFTSSCLYYNSYFKFIDYWPEKVSCRLVLPCLYLFIHEILLLPGPLSPYTYPCKIFCRFRIFTVLSTITLALCFLWRISALVYFCVDCKVMTLQDFMHFVDCPFIF